MKNNSNRTPPLFRGLVIVAGFLLLIWGGFHLWQWHKLRPLRAAMDSFTAESAMEPISIYPVTIQPQQITPKARELMARFVKSLDSPLIENESFGGGWTFHYTAPQGQVSVNGNIVVFVMDDGYRLQARFYRSDKEVYKQLDEEIGRLFDEEAERQGLDIP
ncbi:hypothetical protein DW741_01010 [Ruminococcaceae bacterium AM28-23LB]|nr:hypothetical protein DW741_01010 [Ruminococcaceae bacterium AM28-23LB]